MKYHLIFISLIQKREGDCLKNEMVAVRKMKPAPGLEVTTASVPKIGNNDVLVKVKACSICGSDVHIYNWEHPWDERVKPPRTLGHEITGEIVEIGKNVTSVKVEIGRAHV